MNIGEIWKLISENALVSTLVGAVIVGGVTWIGSAWRDRRDSRIIYDFLSTSSSASDWSFRTSHAISSQTKIPEERVAALCSKHPKIRRNEKARQSWTLVS